MTKKITSKTTLKEILELKDGEKILHKFGVPCVSCPMAKFEIDKLKIGQVCKMYGLDESGILKNLNEK